MRTSDSVLLCYDIFISVDCHRVCYSTHSSLTELTDFIKHFAPKKVIPCVVPDREKDGEEKVEKFQKCFQEVLQSCGIAVEELGLVGDVEKEEENQLVLQPETKEENEAETMVEVETKMEVEEEKKAAVRYYCHGCSQEMPGVAAGITCPACDSGNNTRKYFETV